MEDTNLRMEMRDIEKIKREDGIYLKFLNGKEVGPFFWCDYSWNCGYLRVQREKMGTYQFLDVEGGLSPEYPFAGSYYDAKADIIVDKMPLARDAYGNLWQREELEAATTFRYNLRDYADGKKLLVELDECVFKYPNALEFFKMTENHRIEDYIHRSRMKGIDEEKIMENVKKRQEIISGILDSRFNLDSENEKNLNSEEDIKLGE